MRINALSKERYILQVPYQLKLLSVKILLSINQVDFIRILPENVQRNLISHFQSVLIRTEKMGTELENLL